MTTPNQLPPLQDVLALARKMKATAEDCSPHPRYSDSMIAFRTECIPANVIAVVDALTTLAQQAQVKPFAYMDDDVAAGVLEGSVLLSAAIRGAPGGTFNFPLYTRPQQAQEPVQADAPRSCPDACRTPEKCCNFGCQKATPPAPQPAPVPEGYALISLDALMAWGKLDEVKSACVYPSTNPAPAPQVPAPVDELPDLNPEDIVVDVVLKQLGGFAPVTTHGVRVTHKPSLISVVVDSERSQHRNRQLALEALRAITHHQAHPEPVDELIEALEDLMDWQVKNVALWHNRAYDRAHRAIKKHRAALQSPTPQTKG